MCLLVFIVQKYKFNLFHRTDSQDKFYCASFVGEMLCFEVNQLFTPRSIVSVDGRNHIDDDDETKLISELAIFSNLNDNATICITALRLL